MSDLREYRRMAIEKMVAEDPMGFQLRLDYANYRADAELFRHKVLSFEEWKAQNIAKEAVE